MKILRGLPTHTLNEKYFDICLKSKSGCNIKVDDKFYNVHINNTGEYIVSEFVVDFELDNEEFKKLIK